MIQLDKMDNFNRKYQIYIKYKLYININEQKRQQKR